MTNEIEQFIAENQDWYLEDGKLVAGFEFESFEVVEEIIPKIMELANRLKHHPDVTFGYKTIEIATTTHESDDSITERDFALAKAILGDGPVAYWRLNETSGTTMTNLGSDIGPIPANSEM